MTVAALVCSKPVSNMFIIVLLALAGFLAGLIDSVAGGGGLISTPALLAAGIPPHIALGTNKFQSMCGTTCALANFHRKSKVLWRIAAAGIPFALIGSIFGAKTALFIPSAALGKILVFILPPAAAAIFISRVLLKPSQERELTGAAFWLVTIAACFSIGFYDGFFGPGTGTFFILALTLASKIPLINASATAKTFNLASNLGALVTFIISGSVYYKIGIVMAVANIAGNFIGSHYAIKRGSEFVQKILIVSVTLLFIYLIWKYYL